MKEYQAPQIEVTKFEVEDDVTAIVNFSSFSLDNFGGWDDFVEDQKGGKGRYSDV